MSIRQAQTLKRQLLEGLHVPGELQLEAGEVTHLHAACLQLLAALFISRQQLGQPTGWQNVADELQTAAQHLGLAGVLQLDAAASAPEQTRE